MPVTLHLSNSLQKLSKQLAETLREDAGGVFQSEHFVVQTEGMQRWLSIDIAEQNGIAAQFKFYSPDQLLKRLFHLAGLTTGELITPAQLRWILYEILAEEDFIQAHPAISRYYREDNVKRLLLAATAADRFDQYTVYRPDFILRWNNNEEIKLKKKELAPHAVWQRDLWRRSKKKLAGLGFDMDKTTLGLQLEKRLDDPEVQQAIRKAFPRISFFGLSTFTPFHLQLFLRRIGMITELSFYFMNPAPEEYWYQDISEKAAYWIRRIYGLDPASQHMSLGHPLLMDWGRTAKELNAVFFGQLSEEVQIEGDRYALPYQKHSTSLLRTIQDNIYHNRYPSNAAPLPFEQLSDGSILIASHFTPLREVEGLYDYLIHQMETQGYHPHEMVVLVPNIDQYAPFIEAVFDNAKYKIPYSIADRSYDSMDNPIGVLQALLQFSEEDFSSEGVLQLLETPILLRRTGIGDLEHIRLLIRAANIRFGIRGNPELETDLVSWSAGLERLILGYAMEADTLVQLPEHERPLLPVKLMEGNMATDGLRLVGFVRLLIAFVRGRQQSRTLKEWKRYCLELMDKMMYISDDHMEAYNYILMHLDALEAMDPLMQGTISYEIFARGFSAELFSNQKRGKLITGRLSFSSMIPMRTIPYKLIAILGLNRDKFPRRDEPLSFDLMQDEHKWGDRSVKEHDKYLFLETLIAAGERLYLSYTGQSVKDGSPVPPSPVIENLTEYIARLMPEEADTDPVQRVQEALITRHPMHHFNRRYYDPEHPHLYTYLQYGTGAGTGDEATGHNPEFSEYERNTAQLRSCFKNPVKYYFNHTLGIFYEEPKLLLPEAEPFQLDALEAYKLQEQLLYMKEEEWYEMVNYWKMRGQLPLHHAGEASLESLQSEIRPFRESLQRITADNPPCSIQINVQTSGGVVLEDRLVIYGDSYVECCLSSGPYKAFTSFQISLWLLAAMEIKELKKAVFVYKQKKKILTKDVEIPDKTTALAALEQLAGWEKQAREDILPFYPDACAKWWKALHSRRANSNPEKTFFTNILAAQKRDDAYRKQDKYLAGIDISTYFTPYIRKEAAPGNLLYDITALFYENFTL